MVGPCLESQRPQSATMLPEGAVHPITPFCERARVQRVDGRTDAGLVPISSDRRSSPLAPRTTLIRLQGGGPPSQTHHDWKVQARFGNDKHVFHIARDRYQIRTLLVLIKTRTNALAPWARSIFSCRPSDVRPAG